MPTCRDALSLERPRNCCRIAHFRRDLCCGCRALPGAGADPSIVADSQGSGWRRAWHPYRRSDGAAQAQYRADGGQLQRDDLNDASLLRSRGSLDPVRDELRETIASLERRLDDVDTRMKQIGDPPAAGAPPEEAGLAAERARLQERRTALDGSLKQARLLMLRADNLSERITDRRRALFTRELLGRNSSAVDPKFWSEAARALPDALRGVVLLTQGWIGYARASANEWTITAALLTLVAFSTFAVLFLRWFERRALTPRRLETLFQIAVCAIDATSHCIDRAGRGRGRGADYRCVRADAGPH